MAVTAIKQGFFRRSIQKQIDYKCLRDKQCLVIRLNRNRCQYCRFRKCLDVGMSKDSVRYGRVPKRSREKSEADPPARVINQFTADNEKTEPRQQASMYDIITTISDAYLYHCAYTEAKTRGLVRKPAFFNMSEQQQSNALDGSNADVQKIVLWQQFAHLLCPSVQQVVEFAKKIPGFQELPQDDKLLCIKLGFFEVWLVQASRLISPQDSTITFTDGTTISRQQMEIMFDRDFVNQVFNFVHCFNDLQLSDAEIGLYSAVVLVTAEREGIYDVKSLSHLQDQMISALRYKLGAAQNPNSAVELAAPQHPRAFRGGVRHSQQAGGRGWREVDDFYLEEILNHPTCWHERFQCSSI
ncbi:hypothetical protein JTE90_006053 [Oedothorax gibbosus]|uniref:Ecdysone-induced protein 78C n=1 Tax=Oedothorax gibbosus TaxID=931172 RepID=A0AAV6V4T1_9ARAC|nr:hypothetical protein JTE90_006053 [Oedothorax gibbosus]